MAWARVAAELERRRLGIAWLAKKLNCSLQRVQNWTTRGLPTAAFPEVATALDETTDWLFGLAEPRHKAQTRPPPTSGALALAYAYDDMTVGQQELFLRLLETASRTAVHARPPEMGHSDMMDIELEIEDPKKSDVREQDR